ncbi:MAG: YeaC family protein [Endozoicomonadaceae bacterium]|nr:YeaC family protein [Endozoicomonadaceae bacterium]
MQYYTENYYNYVHTLSPDIITSLKKMIETSKTPQGHTLSLEQIQSSMQAVLLWEKIHIHHEDQTGFIVNDCKKKEKQSEKKSSYIKLVKS